MRESKGYNNGKKHNKKKQAERGNPLPVNFPMNLSLSITSTSFRSKSFMSVKVTKVLFHWISADVGQAEQKQNRILDLANLFAGTFIHFMAKHSVVSCYQHLIAKIIGSVIFVINRFV